MKILKSIIVLTAFLSIGAQAKDIPAQELGKYLKALDMAAGGKRLECSDGNMYLFEQDHFSSSWTTNTIVTGRISDNQSQPLLTFKLVHKDDTNIFEMTEIVTSADLKNVTNMNIRIYRIEQVNNGTIVEPVFRNEPVLKQDLSCKVL